MFVDCRAATASASANRCSSALAFLKCASRSVSARSVAVVHRPVFKDNLICGPLGTLEDFFGRFRAPQIDGAQFASEMERNRGQAEAFLKHGGQQMLAGVLLHVVETAGPVDAALGFAE